MQCALFVLKMLILNLIIFVASPFLQLLELGCNQCKNFLWRYYTYGDRYKKSELINFLKRERNMILFFVK